MCYVIELCVIAKLPALITLVVLGVNGEHSPYLAITCDQVFSRRDREVWLLHDEAVFFHPPVCAVEFPLCWGDTTCSLQSLIPVQPHSPRARIETPQAPRLCTRAGVCTGITQRRDVHWRPQVLELHLVLTSSVSRLSQGSGHHQQSHRKECAAHQALRSTRGFYGLRTIAA